MEEKREKKNYKKTKSRIRYKKKGERKLGETQAKSRTIYKKKGERKSSETQEPQTTDIDTTRRRFD